VAASGGGGGCDEKKKVTMVASASDVRVGGGEDKLVKCYFIKEKPVGGRSLNDLSVEAPCV
jgi:hypothetical protein